MKKQILALLFLSVTLACSRLTPTSSSTSSSTKNSQKAAPIDCSSTSANACDTWSPATTPFNGTYDHHSCVAWRDAAGANVHGANADACKLSASADPGTKIDLLGSCPTANRVGGCMIATEYSCEVQYNYADPSVLPEYRMNKDATRDYCTSIGGTFVD